MFVYSAAFTPDEADGGFVVTFRDVPEAITQADTVAECLLEAADCLEEAIAARINNGEDIPEPSDALEGEHPVSLPAHTAVKAVIFLAMRERGLSQADLSRRLAINEKEVRRILDPHHKTKLPRMEQALAAMGKQLQVSISDIENSARAA